MTPREQRQELADEIVDAIDKGLPCTADAKFLLSEVPKVFAK
jgi:hypothetical protein